MRRLIALVNLTLTSVPVALLLGALEDTPPAAAYVAAICALMAAVLALEGFFPRRYRFIAVPLSVVAAAASLPFLPYPILSRFLFAVPLMLYGLAAAGVARAITDRAMTVQQMTISAAVYGVAYVAAYLMAVREILPALGIWCAVTLVLCVVQLNVSSTDSVAGKNGARALRLGNLAMTLAFVAVALILINIGAIKDFFVAAVAAIGRAILWFVNLFARDEAVQEEGVVGDGGDMGALPVEEQGPNLLAEIFYYVAVVIAVAVLAALLVMLFIRIGKLLAALYRKLRDWLSTGERAEDEYEDEQFTLMTWQQARTDIVNNITNALKRITYRPPRWEGLTNRERLRCAMEAILYRGGRRTPDATLTAQEHARELPPRKGADPRAFADAYDRARYSDLPVSDEDAANARRFV